MRTQEKVKAFAALVAKETAERLTRLGFDLALHSQSLRVDIIAGTKYVKVNVGGSGKYMIDLDGTIYGIRSYGQVNKRHNYGNLDTTHRWNWGDFSPRQVTA